MHVVATNIIIWIRTLIKESLEEINEYEIEENSERSSSSMTTLAENSKSFYSTLPNKRTGTAIF